MKKITIFLYLLLAAGICRAQTDDIYYRDGKQTITVDGITFNVELWHNSVLSLENENNYWLSETQWYYEDGTPLTTEEEMDAIKFSLNDPWMHIRVMKEIFTPEEIAALSTERYAPLTLMCAFDSSGVLQEVGFLCSVVDVFARVSPARFALLEKRLKERMKGRFHPTSPKVQFVTLRNFVHFDGWDEISTESRPPAPEN